MPELVALTRAVSPSMAACELTHQPREPIDIARAAAQHAAYEQALAQLGCRVNRLAAAADLPDSVFVEDTAVVLDEIALIMRPGAESRRKETADVEEWLKHQRLLARIEPPGTMDGGDVLAVGRSVFVGASSRTNAAGIEQLRQIVEYFGYALHVVDVGRCLHLKSGVTAVADDTLLINPRWISADPFGAFELIEVDPGEPAAANIARVGGHLLYSAAFPATRDRVVELGHTVTVLDLSEIAKAEGAVTCCSVIFNAAAV